MTSALAEFGVFLAAHWKLILTIAYLAWAVAVIVALILARRPSAATLAWALALLALPYAGAAVYLFFGPRRLYRKKLRYARARRQIGQVAPGLGATAGSGMGEEMRVRQRQLARLATELGQPAPLRADEPVTLYIHGDDCCAAIEAAIRAATDHVHVEYYIWDPGRAGDRLRDALAKRARAGVKVRLLLDDVGSGGASDDYFATVTRAGGELAWFNPLRISRFRPTLLNFRTHRKIVVVDGRIGFTGGMNVSDVQSREGSAHSGTPERGNTLQWRDTHLRIVGAPVGALQRVFLDDWAFAFGACKVNRRTFRRAGATRLARACRSSPRGRTTRCSRSSSSSSPPSRAAGSRFRSPRPTWCPTKRHARRSSPRHCGASTHACWCQSKATRC
jgi:cardiolipin synthase